MIVDGSNRYVSPASTVTCCTPPTSDAVADPGCGRRLTEGCWLEHPAEDGRDDHSRARRTTSRRDRNGRSDARMHGSTVPARDRADGHCSGCDRTGQYGRRQGTTPRVVPRPGPAAEHEQPVDQTRGEPPDEQAPRLEPRADPAGGCSTANRLLGSVSSAIGTRATAATSAGSTADDRVRVRPPGQHRGHHESRRRQEDRRQLRDRHAPTSGRARPPPRPRAAPRTRGSDRLTSTAPPGNATCPAWVRICAARWISSTLGPSVGFGQQR